MTRPGSTVSLRTKIFYGLGLGAEGIKNNTFNVFLLLFYQQVVGLDIRLCGIALFITLMIDAIGDPLIGSWSDRLVSKLGRRLPFMFASSLPLAAGFWCTFNPPLPMSQTGIFVWLVVFASAARFSMSLFSLPHQSLVAELTRNHGERVSLQNWRNIFGWGFGLLNVWLGWNIFLATSAAYPIGVLNPIGYRHFALWGALMLVICTSVSTLGISSAVLRSAPRQASAKSIRIGEFPRAMWKAIVNSASYRAALGGGLLMWMAFGTTENTRNYMNSYYWGFSSEQSSILIYVIVGSLLMVWASARPLARRIGKRKLAAFSMVLFALCEPSAISLRLMDIAPANGDSALLWVLTPFWFFGFLGIIMAMTVWGAMIADVADEYELRTGARQEGLLYSAGTFLQKSATGGGGVLASSIVLFSRFPSDSLNLGVTSTTLTKFGLLSVFATTLLGLLCAYCFSRFKLDDPTDVLERASLSAMPKPYLPLKNA